MLDEATLTNSPLLPYVRLVVNLIEGRQLGRQELLQLLGQVLRQHRIAARSTADYVREDQQQHPP